MNSDEEILTVRLVLPPPPNLLEVDGIVFEVLGVECADPDDLREYADYTAPEWPARRWVHLGESATYVISIHDANKPYRVCGSHSYRERPVKVWEIVQI